MAPLRGLGFILPAVLLLFAFSHVYAAHGSLPWVSALLYGLQAAVVALVLQAMTRIARRALQSSLHLTLALVSFLALEFAHVPFPIVLLIAAAVGAYLRAPRDVEEAPMSNAAPVGAGQTAGVAAVGLTLWLIPLLVVAATLGATSLWTAVYLFFTKAALVTFGGAYAVLGYVTSQVVDKLAWVTADQSVAGLALAETTPGPLIIVLQFMGFMAGWNQPGPLSPLGSALLAGALATWATFLPSFLFILLGAPYVERLTRNARIEGALRRDYCRGRRHHCDAGAAAGPGGAVSGRVARRAGLESPCCSRSRRGSCSSARAGRSAPCCSRPLQAGYSCDCCSSESSRCWNTPRRIWPRTSLACEFAVGDQANHERRRRRNAARGRQCRVGTHGGQHRGVGAAAREAGAVQSRTGPPAPRSDSWLRSDGSRNSASRYSQNLPCWPAQRAATAAGRANSCIGSGRSRVAKRTLPVST
ncbi:MAG: chromate transporter [Proteobacteria bacterium]|nr:chromate transporter [Pseudomonadota bacterium]